MSISHSLHSLAPVSVNPVCVSLFRRRTRPRQRPLRPHRFSLSPHMTQSRALFCPPLTPDRLGSTSTFRLPRPVWMCSRLRKRSTSTSRSLTPKAIVRWRKSISFRAVKPVSTGCSLPMRCQGTCWAVGRPPLKCLVKSSSRSHQVKRWSMFFRCSMALQWTKVCRFDACYRVHCECSHAYLLPAPKRDFDAPDRRWFALLIFASTNHVTFCYVPAHCAHRNLSHASNPVSIT